MDNQKFSITESMELKQLTSENYNYVYNRNLNIIVRWGSTKEDNPTWAPFGPEYAIINTKDMTMEMFNLVLGIINMNKTLATIMLTEQNEAFIQYCITQNIIPSYNVKNNNAYEAGLFSLYVENNGDIKPDVGYADYINVIDVQNFYKEVWQGNLFKKYRWQKLQELAK